MGNFIRTVSGLGLGFKDWGIYMEIRVLRYFLAIAREGSITAAADFLHVTQPTLSRQIRDLEDELGKRLFNRGSHSITLTAEGMILRRRAEEIVSMADRTEAEFASMSSSIAGDIYIGSGETDAVKLIAEVMAELRREYPDIRYHIFSGNADDVTERLDKGLIDFGVLIQPADISKYDCVTIPAKDRWGLLVRNDHPLAKKENITSDDLIGIPLIASRQLNGQNQPKSGFLHWFGEDFGRLDIVATYNLIYNAGMMVRQGMGCAVAIDKLIYSGEGSDLKFIPFYPPLESGLDIVWKKYQVFSSAAEIFINRLTEKFRGANNE